MAHAAIAVTAAASSSVANGPNPVAAVTERKNKAECVVVVYNVAKKRNVGDIVRSAVAFGASRFIVVGARKLQMFGSFGTSSFIAIESYQGKIADCLDGLRKEGYALIGIEISPDARSITSQPAPFAQKSAFILGNEGSGLSEAVIKLCDWLVYIPQYGTGTASLNVCVAASIVLQHFAVFAQFPETSRKGFKFVVDDSTKLPRTIPSRPVAVKTAQTVSTAGDRKVSPQVESLNNDGTDAAGLVNMYNDV